MIPLDRVKACSRPGCRLVFPADPADELAAGFWVAQRYASGRIRYQAWCKDCQRERARAHAAVRRRAAGQRPNPPAWLGEYEGRIVLFRRCTDCGVEGPCIDGPDSLFQRHVWRGRVSWRCQCRVCTNRRRRKSYRRERARLRELKRIDAAILAERQGSPLRERRGAVVDRTNPRKAAGPFVEWLGAYRRARGLSVPELAAELGLVERRVRSLLAGEQQQVSVDVVSRALTDARIVVSVGGRVIVTFEDLYGEGGIRG